MDKEEFDKFAEEYKQLHAKNIKASGESPEFFAEYKVIDARGVLSAEQKSGLLKVLDFGAGVGTSIPYFIKHFDDVAITCLDVSDKSLDIGREKYSEKARFIHYDGGNIPFEDNQFDLVFVACVFHHIDHAEHPRILEEFHRILKSDGVLIIFEHNPYNPLTVQAVNNCEFDENAVLIKPHVMKSNFFAGAFSNIYTKYRIFFPGFLRGLRPLENLMTAIPVGAQYYVVGRKTLDT